MGYVYLFIWGAPTIAPPAAAPAPAPTKKNSVNNGAKNNSSSAGRAMQLSQMLPGACGGEAVWSVVVAWIKTQQ